MPRKSPPSPKRARKAEVAPVSTITAMVTDKPALDYQRVRAARKLQRIWRTVFKHARSQVYAIECMKPGVGVPAEYIKSIR